MASEGLDLPQEVDYDVEEKQGEKEASKFQAKLTEFGVSIPKSSAMNIMLRRLQLKFRAHSERDADWHGQKLEDARIDSAKPIPGVIDAMVVTGRYSCTPDRAEI